MKIIMYTNIMAYTVIWGNVDHHNNFYQYDCAPFEYLSVDVF